MFSDIPWFLDIEDSLDDLFVSDKDCYAAIKLFSSLGFEVENPNSTEQDGLEKYLYLHGNQNLNYVVLERECMAHASLFCNLFRIKSDSDNDDSVAVFYIELDSSFKDRDYYACAIIKLVTKALSCNALFLFKHLDEICFGAGDNLTEYGEFVISKWADRVESVSLVEEVFDSKIDEANLKKTYFNFFETILGCSHLNKQVNNKNYSSVTEEFKYNGVSLIGYNEKFTNSDDNEYRFSSRRKKRSPLYQLTSDLAYIDHDDIDSYELLEKAMNAEEQSRIFMQQNRNVEILSETEINNLKSINDDVLNNAENLLRFLEEKDKK